MSDVSGNDEDCAFTVTGSRFQFVCEDMRVVVGIGIGKYVLGNRFLFVGSLSSEPAVLLYSDYCSFQNSSHVDFDETWKRNILYSSNYQWYPMYGATNNSRSILLLVYGGYQSCSGAT